MVSEMKDCLQEELTLLESSMEKIIREAAKIMLEADAHRLNVKQKAGTANFVTEYDVRVQRCLEAAWFPIPASPPGLLWTPEALPPHESYFFPLRTSVPVRIH